MHDSRLDILQSDIVRSSLDQPTKNALADDLEYAASINGTKDEALQGIKRLVISNIRRELLAQERTEASIEKHAQSCPRNSIPKTGKEFVLRVGSQYPLIIVLGAAWAVGKYGLGWLLGVLGRI